MFSPDNKSRLQMEKVNAYQKMLRIKEEKRRFQNSQNYLRLKFLTNVLRCGNNLGYLGKIREFSSLI